MEFHTSTFGAALLIHQKRILHADANEHPSRKAVINGYSGGPLLDLVQALTTDSDNSCGKWSQLEEEVRNLRGFVNAEHHGPRQKSLLAVLRHLPIEAPFWCNGFRMCLVGSCWLPVALCGFSDLSFGVEPFRFHASAFNVSFHRGAPGAVAWKSSRCEVNRSLPPSNFEMLGIDIRCSSPGSPPIF